MEEYYEVISHIPLQYVSKLENIKILIIETSDNILMKYVN